MPGVQNTLTPPHPISCVRGRNPTPRAYASPLVYSVHYTHLRELLDLRLGGPLAQQHLRERLHYEQPEAPVGEKQTHGEEGEDEEVRVAVEDGGAGFDL
jgi:hypothetical protein